MAATIVFNDGSGSQTITPTPPVSRFNRWHPGGEPIGEKAHGVGDGIGYAWTHRTDHIASWELPHLANSDMGKLIAFQLWANKFGVFTMNTGDAGSRSYTQCQIAPGTRIEISDPDPETLEYRLTGTTLNKAGNPMLCIYP